MNTKRSDVEIHHDVLEELRWDPRVDATEARGLERSDTEIAQAVRDTLEWDVFVPGERVTSTVADGQVTLAGTVDWLSQLDAAERAVRNLTGVKAVVNLIRVKTPKPAPANIRVAIERALDRRAEREARQITVDVHDGLVTLTGPVRSWSERRAVVGAARGTAGVRAVLDELWPIED